MKKDNGSATVIVFMVVVILSVGMIGLGSVASLYAARVGASNAADAAALAAAVATYPPAGAGDPREEARIFALRNGALVRECRCPIDATIRARIVTVIVETKIKVPFFGVMPVRAGARAEFDPLLWLGR